MSKKDFTEYCQVKGCGKPSTNMILAIGEDEKHICDECFKKYYPKKEVGV